VITTGIVVEKYLASGKFDKMKARLVIDGSGRGPELYPDKSSPTVAIQLVLTMLARNPACLSWATIIKIDIKGAHVQTPMEGPPMYAKLDPQITKFIIALYPDLKNYVQDDGCLVILVQKEMYRCIQSGKLWYNLLTKKVQEEEWGKLQVDACIMRKIVQGKACIIMIYIDDLLVVAIKGETENETDKLGARFGEITVNEGQELSYLEMKIK
jgi:hypothetical protein